MIYASAEVAGNDLESVDVEAGEYRAFDGAGRHLRLAGKGPHGKPRRLPGGLTSVDVQPVSVEVAEMVPTHEGELKRLLLEALGASVKEAARCSLPDLIARAVSEFGLRR